MITEEMILRIEQAFGLHLYDWQKDYLLHKPCSFPYGKRGAGKTFIYCVSLLLSDGKPIQCKRLEFTKYADDSEVLIEDSLGHSRYKIWFADYMKEINDKLVAEGFETRVKK